MLNPQLESHIQRLESCDDDHEHQSGTELHPESFQDQPQTSMLMTTSNSSGFRDVIPWGFSWGIQYQNLILFQRKPLIIVIGLILTMIHQIIPLAFARSCVLLVLVVDLLLRVDKVCLTSQQEQNVPVALPVTPEDPKLIEIRRKLSGLLACVAAPILQAPMPALLRTTEMPLAQHLEVIEQSAEMVVGWLKTVDESLYILDVSTSVQLSLGYHSRSVRRMERTAITKARRSGGDNNSWQGTFIAQPIHRRRLFQAIKQINDIMLRVCDTTSRQAAETTEEIVVTLILLKSLRAQSGELISRMVEQLTIQELLTENELSNLQALQFAVAESNEYMKSCFCIKHHYDSQTNLVTDRDLAIARVQGIVDCAQQLLGCIQSVTIHEDLQLRETSLQLNKLWIELISMCSKLQSEAIEGQANFVIEEPCDKPTCFHSAEIVRSNAEQQEYVVDAKAESSKDHQESLDSIRRANKVTIFSGRGSLESDVQVAPHHISDRNSMPQRLREAESLVVQELQRHLKTMPLHNGELMDDEPDSEVVETGTRHLENNTLFLAPSPSEQVLAELAVLLRSSTCILPEESIESTTELDL